MTKFAEGRFSKTFLLTMETGKQTMTRISNPNAGAKHHTPVLEVATMQFLRRKLVFPVPKFLLAHATLTIESSQNIV